MDESCIVAMGSIEVGGRHRTWHQGQLTGLSQETGLPGTGGPQEAHCLLPLAQPDAGAVTQVFGKGCPLPLQWRWALHLWVCIKSVSGLGEGAQCPPISCSLVVWECLQGRGEANLASIPGQTCLRLQGAQPLAGARTPELS